MWIKGIFAVQFTDVDAVHAITGDLALNMDPGETTGIAITRDSHDDAQRTIVGAYEYQHRNRDIHRNLESRREKRRNRRGRLRRLPARFNNRANNRSEGWLPPSVRALVEDTQAIVQTMYRLYPINRIRVEYLRFDTQLIQNLDVRGAEYQRGTLWGWQLREYILQRDHRVCQYCNKPGTKGRPLTLDHVIPVLHQDRADEPPRHVCCGVVRVDLDDGAEVLESPSRTETGAMRANWVAPPVAGALPPVCPQSHTAEHRLQRISSPQAYPVLDREVVEAHERIPVPQNRLGSIRTTFCPSDRPHTHHAAARTPRVWAQQISPSTACAPQSTVPSAAGTAHSASGGSNTSGVPQWGTPHRAQTTAQDRRLFRLGSPAGVGGSGSLPASDHRRPWSVIAPGRAIP